jgi:hypothetical protein
MDDMAHSKPETPRHAARWTFMQAALAAAAAAAAAAITPLFFASLFMTVWGLLRSVPYGAWPWIVPLACEGCFMTLFLVDVLLVLRRKPRGRLRFAPYLFAAGSLVLNFLAGRGSVPATTGHVMVTLAFFATVTEGEEAVRKLAVADRDARVAGMMADARRYAVDVARDRRGLLWRWRVPALLRRDIASGRLSDEVRQAVEMAVSVGRSSGWRKPVLEWVTRELRLPAEAEAADRRALEDITRGMPPAPVRDMPGASPQGMPGASAGAVSRAGAEHAPQRGPGHALRLTAARSRGMTPDRLADHVGAMLDKYGEVSLNRVKGDLHVGTAKAQKALDIARRRRLSVVPEAAARKRA